jgi:chemotaxis protein methyltransferase CheR
MTPARQSVRTGAGRGESLVEGDLLLTYEDFRRIAAMLHDDAGIFLPEGKVTLVYSRLAKRLRALGLQSFRDYCEIVASAEGIDERKRMLAQLTTNVTRFFREPHHFEHLKTQVLPGLVAKAKAGGRVRLWSAACSSGQEPYSMALTLLSLMPDAADYDVKILATDIDPNILAEARRGIYGEDAVSQIPSYLRQAWLTPADSRGRKSWAVKPEVQDLIAFRELNLIGEWPMKGTFQVIFCRNVVIYFEEQTQIKIWNRFKNLMPDGGRLYIGHSERVAGTGNDFETDGLTTYRRVGGPSR